MSKARMAIFGAGLAALAASTHAYQLFLEWHHLKSAGELGILTSSSFALLQFLFVLSFAACLVGLLLRNFPGLITTLLGLVGVMVGYAYWYSYSTRWLERLDKDSFYSEHPEFLPRHSFGLVGAHWWDVALLGFSVVLLISILTVLFRPRTTRVQLS